MRRSIVLLLAAALAGNVSAQERAVRDHPRVQEALHVLETWVDAERAYQEIPGISMAVVYDQDVLWQKGFGLAVPARNVAATPQTIYSICSISKLFTAIGVMQLRDRGKLRLDDPVVSHLPWFRIQDAYPDAPPATIEGILTHSSGLPRESDYPYWSPPDFPFPTREQIRERVGSQQELYPAATFYQYSNLGLAAAGEVVAAVSGEDYDGYIRRHILDPLGMRHTTPEIPATERGQGLAVGYTARTREGVRSEVPLFQARGIAPAAGFASTVEDLAKFASWQFRVLYHGEDDVLVRNTLREMYRVHWLDPDWSPGRGLGFGVWRSDDKTFVGHGGSCPGYRSHFNVQPDERIAVIVMTNASGVNTNALTQRGYEIVGPAIAAALDTAHAAPSLNPAFDAYVGTYSELPWTGEVAVVPWKESLALLYLPSDDPIDDLVRLEHVGADTFRRIREDGSLGEEIHFDVDETGRAVRLWRHSNFSPRIP
jgi:CubicO group peptidase (beta-lactamase class C family)